MQAGHRIWPVSAAGLTFFEDSPHCTQTRD